MSEIVGAPVPQSGGAGASDIEFHYGVSNEFYRRWLDPEMVYSCALWDAAGNLADAQIAKLDYHVGQARAGRAGRVLDIGCGWGALLRRLVHRHEVGRAVGLTLSESQASWIAQERMPGIEVVLSDWRDYAAAEPFDSIISIGAFEHFARFGLSHAQKVGEYRAFFEACRRLLGPGGYVSIQTISAQDMQPEQLSRFIADSVFPKSDLPTLAEIVEALPRGLELVALRNDRLDYAKTCNEWLRNLRTNRAECSQLVGPEVVAKYEKYLGLSALGFRIGRTGLLRFTLRKT